MTAVTPAGASGQTRIDTLVKTTTPRLIQTKHTVTAAGVRLVRTLYPLAQEGMRSGLYYPNRGSIFCSRDAGTRWRETGFVFTSQIGTPFEPRRVNKEFTRLCKRAGLPQIRVHDLRHTCASLLLAQGVSFKVIQEILGHSDIRVTMNLYAHLYPEARRDAADKMDAVLSPVAQLRSRRQAELTRQVPVDVGAGGGS